MRSRAFLIPVILGLMLAACGGSASTTPASSSAAVPSVAADSAAPASAAASGGTGAACAPAAAGATATVKVSIKDFKYDPPSVNAKVGDVIEWTNNDSAPHSATMDDNACDTDSIAGGSSAMLTFSAAGTYTYHCKIHPAQMKDVTVVVQ
jgi:plastocyanin